MIEVDKDSAAELNSTDAVASPVTPDAVRTEEVVVRHNNFEVHDNVAPSPHAETAIEALPSGETNMTTDTLSSAAVPEETQAAHVYGESPFDTSPAVPAVELAPVVVPPVGSDITPDAPAAIPGVLTIPPAGHTAAANIIDPSRIGAHDAHAVIDPVSATQYAPQTPYHLDPKFSAGIAVEKENIDRILEAGMAPIAASGEVQGYTTRAEDTPIRTDKVSAAETAPASDSTGAMASAGFGTPGTEKAVEAVFGEGRKTQDEDMSAFRTVYGEDRLPDATAPITSTGAAVDTDPNGAGDTTYALGGEPKPAASRFTAVESLDLSVVPEPERIVTAKGVDLTRLTRFNEERSAQPPRTNKPKGPRPEGQQPQAQGKKPKGAKPQQQPKQGKQAPVTPPPPPVINRNAKSQDYLRQAMGDRFEGQDGIDHINTSSMGVTGMGRDLDINAKTPFHHPDLGPFASVGGLWYFVGAEVNEANPNANDKFRYLFGKACRVEGQTVKMREVLGFRTIIAEATWIKVRSIEKLSNAMMENEMPYRSYYTVGERFLRKSTPIAEWYMPVLEEIGRTLKLIRDGQADAVPNFDFLDQPAAEEAPADTRGGRHEQRQQRQNRSR